MKLRLRGNSLRLRLAQGEVAELVRTGRVEETVAFGPRERLSYALTCKETAAIAARFEAGAVEVSLPAGLAMDWASSERVGLEAEQPIGEGAHLRILVEKDFACLKPRTGENDSDAFPNPNTSCGGGCE
jgi:hypothetical protein